MVLVPSALFFLDMIYSIFKKTVSQYVPPIVLGFLQIIAIPDLFLYNNATSMKKGELLCLTSAANAVNI